MLTKAVQTSTCNSKARQTRHRLHGIYLKRAFSQAAIHKCTWLMEGCTTALLLVQDEGQTLAYTTRIFSLEMNKLLVVLFYKLVFAVATLQEVYLADKFVL